MASVRVENATLLATMDDDGTEIAGGGLVITDGVITAIGPTADLPGADEVIDARDMVLLPGLVNTHHHATQTLTRAMAQDAELFTWLRTLYPVWARLTPEAVHVSTQVALAELALSGCTTAFDHTYLWPNGARVDDQVAAAGDIGLRFHVSRGSMSRGESDGGLPPDHVVEDEKHVLADSQRVIEAFHDPAPGAMTQVVLAPCSPFSVTPDLMRESIALARSYGVHSHTHLAETVDEDAFCRSMFGRSPVELCEDLGWTGPDVWFAHFVHPSPAEVVRVGAARTGATHCPSSNMRLASGVAPIGAWSDAGMRTGLGVDGSASNDGSHLLAEARMAMLLQRVGGRPDALSARGALRMATRGGAEVLGRDDIGRLEVGMMGDVIGIRLDTLAMAGGAVHDPLGAVVFCQPPTVDLSLVGGRTVVRDGVLQTIDTGPLVERHNRIARSLL
ncbi:MAG: 8-oxoguanine deaminase [Aeromicrobium sp.]